MKIHELGEPIFNEIVGLQLEIKTAFGFQCIQYYPTDQIDRAREALKNAREYHHGDNNARLIAMIPIE